MVRGLGFPFAWGLVGFQASQWASFGGGFASPMEIADIRLFHLPSEERGLIVDHSGEIDDSVVSRAEDNPEAFEFLDVCFEIRRLRFKFILDLSNLLVVDLEFRFPLVSAKHSSEGGASLGEFSVGQRDVGDDKPQ